MNALYLYAKHKKVDKMPASEKKAIIKELSLKMKAAAKELNFEEAARLRDEITKIKKLKKNYFAGLFIETKKSLLFFVFFNLERRNSIASIVPIGAKILLNTFIF